MPTVIVLQHAACEPLGLIEDALITHGLSLHFVQAENGDLVPPEIGEAAGLIVLGGSMGVHDKEQFPFLAEEVTLIKSAVAQNVPVLGVCLGAQLLAFALGGAVKRNTQQEIGWHSVTLADAAADDSLWRSLPQTWTGFHWHGDIFETPPGAVSLASSALTPCQAFRFGPAAYGFQFHLEVTEAIVCDWAREFAGELTRENLSAEPILAGISEHLPPMQALAQEVFGRWAALV